MYGTCGFGEMLWNRGGGKQSRWGNVLMAGVLLTLLPSAGYAAESLKGIYLKAKANDPTLEGAGYVREASRESLRQAWAQLLPSVNAVYQETQTSQNIMSSDNQVYAQGQSDYTTTEYTVSLKQPIFNYSLYMGVGQARTEQKKADLELDAAQQDLIVRVAERYLNALASQDQLEFARAELTAVTQHHELASARFEFGLAPITDLYDAKARLASREARVTEAESQRADALQALQELSGEVPEALVNLKPEVDLPLPLPDDVEQWVNRAVQQNLAVEAQRRVVEIAGKEVSKQRSGHYPTLDLLGRHNNQATDGSLFGGASEVETQDIVLQLNVPIFQGGFVNSRTRQAAEQYNKAQADLKKLTAEVVRLARSSFLGVKSSIVQVKALGEAVESQQLTLEAKQEGYRSGLFTSLAVLDAERDLFNAKMEYAKARYDYIYNSLKLRQAVGTLSEADLLQADTWFMAQL